MTPKTVMPVSRPLRGEVRIPGDKSITHRAVIFSALAKGTSRIDGYLPSDDCLRTVAAFRQMGVVFEEVVQDGMPTLRVMGTGELSEPSEVIDCGNSGTTMRLLTGLLAGQSFFSVLTGDASLRRRPMRRVIDPLRRMGAEISGRADDHLAPLAIRGRRLSGMDHALPIASAQMKSALLLAGLTASGVTRVREPAPSRDHTERMLSHFGLPCERRDGWIGVHGGGALRGVDIAIPGDFSSAAFFLVAGAVVEGSEVIVDQIGVNPTRTGLIDVLREMGADIVITPRPSLCGEPVAQMTVRWRRLRGTDVSGDRLPSMIDEFPILCVAAAVADGETVIRGAAELRVKESDRIAAMAEALSAVGVTAEALPDGIRIRGGGRLTGGGCQTHGDHRVAMAMAVAALVARRPIVLDDTDSIETSFPDFMAQLASLTSPK